MLKKLIIPERDVRALHSALQSEVSSAFGLPQSRGGQFARRTLSGARQSTFEFRTANCLYATDQRGAERPVVEVARGRGWQALAGASTTWTGQARNRLAFVDCQIIVFLHQIDAATGPRQLLRLEWEALDGNEDGNLEGEIAHPHWQIDLSDFETQAVPFPSDELLVAIPGQPAAPDLAWSSRLHMAAAARWMSERWSDARPTPHVAGPQSTDEVRNWLAGACRYTRYQISEALTP